MASGDTAPQEKAPVNPHHRQDLTLQTSGTTAVGSLHILGRGNLHSALSAGLIGGGYTRALLAWKGTQSLCGSGACANPARRELKFLCMHPAAAARLMGSRLRRNLADGD